MFNTASTSENLSRHDLIQWMNDSLEMKYTRVEELCSGERGTARRHAGISSNTGKERVNMC